MGNKMRCLTLAAMFTVPSLTAASEASPPLARTVDVVEERFGVKVPDPYRWMEGQPNAAELADWLRAQGRHTEEYFAKLAGRARLLARIRELGLGETSQSAAALAGGRTFYLSVGAGEQIGKLMVRREDGRTSTLVDPAKFAGSEGHAAIDSYSPSPDGKWVAYDLSLAGGEIGSMHLIDVDSGRDQPEVIDRIWGEFTARWLSDSSGFFYTQMAVSAKGVDPLLNMTARLHRLGDTVDRDVTVLAGAAAPAMTLAPEEFPVVVEADSGWLIAAAQGAHLESRFAIAKLGDLDRSGGAKTRWQSVAENADGVEAAVAHGDRLYLLSFKGASNRRILSVPLAHPDLANARIELDEDPTATKVAIASARDGLYVQELAAGQARILRLPWTTRSPATVRLPFDGSVDELVTDPRRDGVLVNLQGWTRPNAYFRAGGQAQATFEPTGVASQTTADFSAVVAEEVEVKSVDGTLVPLSILRRKDLVLDGSHPAVLQGFGAYGLSLTPTFAAISLAWLERGGVLAYAHVRGGGEKGRAWQTDGSHERKQNGINDFIACAEYLLSSRLTSKARLAAQAGGGGGILVGDAFLQRPDLFAAVFIRGGVMNPMRLLAAEDGANHEAEWGNPDTEAGFKALLAMDPYLQVVPGTAYPAILFAVGLNDHRVPAWMPGKMAARLQAASNSGRPILISVDRDAGHGVGSTRDQAFAQRADAWAFMLAAFGVRDSPDAGVQAGSASY